jgi:hypothetical protein
MNGGANLGDLWTGFAKRGCGYSATSPSGSTSNGVVEAFDTPVVFTYPIGRPSQLMPNQATVFQVNIAGIGSLQPLSGTGLLHVSINGGGFVPIAMNETSANQYNATLPAGSCFDNYQYYVSTSTTSGTSVNPAGAPAVNFSASVYTSTVVAFDDNFEANLGWTTSVQGASTGAWERGIPVNDPAWAYDPTTDGDGSSRCYLTMNQLGNTDVDGGSVTLISPSFDMTGGADLRYYYYLFLTIEDGVDRLLVEMSDNGGASWSTVAIHTTSGGTSWRTNTISSAQISGAGLAFTANMRVRYTANDSGTASIVEGGVDGVRVSKLLCDDGSIGTSFCPADGSGGICPCLNHGGFTSGCQNSASTGGASLTAVGTVSPDTVVLTSTGELPSALTIFLQGDQAIFPVTYGDGLRCVGGTLKRLFSHNAVAGTVSAPQGGDLSITARSAALNAPITPGQTRYYMTYYRDPNAGFCAPHTFNGSNALSITW